MDLLTFTTAFSQLGPFFAFLLYFSLFAILVCGIVDFGKKRFYWTRWAILLLIISILYLVIEVILSFAVTNSLSG